MLKEYRTDSNASSIPAIHIVAVRLQDDELKGTVYARVVGNAFGLEVLEKAIDHFVEGDVYEDKECSQLVQDGFFEIVRTPRRKDDFVFLIDREIVERFVVGVEIVDFFV